MEAIVKVISLFLGLFCIANGIWVAYQPPLGDELIGAAIIVIGIVIPVVTLLYARMDESRYD